LPWLSIFARKDKFKNAGETPAVRESTALHPRSTHRSRFQLQSRGARHPYPRQTSALGSRQRYIFRDVSARRYSLPNNVRRAFEFEKRDIVATAQQAKRPLSPTEEKKLEKLISQRIQTKLDAGIGKCFLALPAIADLVAETLMHFEASRHRMYAWCVMPNHVHTLFRLLAGHSLSEVLQAWKSYSGKKANRLLSRSGEFWQHEYYDHLVRSEEEFYRIVDYIAANPSKAGLRDWRWVGVNLEA